MGVLVLVVPKMILSPEGLVLLVLTTPCDTFYYKGMQLSVECLSTLVALDPRCESTVICVAFVYNLYSYKAGALQMLLYSIDVEYQPDPNTKHSQSKTGEIDKQLNLGLTDKRKNLIITTKVGVVNISEYLNF